MYDLINDEPPPYEEEQHGVPIESIIKQIIEEYLQNGMCILHDSANCLMLRNREFSPSIFLRIQ